MVSVLFIHYESFRILDEKYGAPETPAAQRGSSSHSGAQNCVRRWWRWQRRQDHPPLLHLNSRHGGRPPAPLILDCSQNIQLPVLDIWWVNVSLLSKWLKCTYNKHVATFRVHIYHTGKNCTYIIIYTEVSILIVFYVNGYVTSTDVVVISTITIQISYYWYKKYTFIGFRVRFADDNCKL